MKFGKNLAHLLIPEWKVYNLDYNDLKSSIRAATLDPSPQKLKELAKSFQENFEYLNLFLATKYGEVSRKIALANTRLPLILQENASLSTKYQNLVNFRYELTSDVSLIIRKLTKFILVQKIAVKKIFKKLIKHYPHPEDAKKLVYTLSCTLASNPSSFASIDLSPITSDLAALLDSLDHGIKSIHHSLHKKVVAKNNGKLHKNPSQVTIKTLQSEASSDVSSVYDNVRCSELVLQQPCRFDTVALLKKNFYLHCLLPKDMTLRNDLYLSIDVHWNIPKVKLTDRVSIIYFSQSPDDSTPSFIISSQKDGTSLLVAHTGGLRKYSYCSLPNRIVNGLLKYFQASDVQTQVEAEHLLSDYLSSEDHSIMTTLTVNAFVSNNMTPSLQIVCDRTRYFLHKNASQVDNDDLDEDDSNSESVSPLSNAPSAPVAADSSTIPSTTETKDYEDNYYLMLDEDIVTSSSIGSSIDFSTENKEPFPFGMCSFHTNDTNLHNFDLHLKTTVTGNALLSKFKPVYLKKLPVKVQNFLQDGSVHPFKNFSIYDYMRSCYFNMIPQDPNNHYTKILNINLLKNFENVEIMNHLNTYDQAIIEDRSRMILHKQMSCKSLHTHAQESHESHQKHDDNLDSNSIKPFGYFDADYMKRLADLDNLDDDYDEDASYFLYLSYNVELEDTLMNSVILSMIRSKQHILKGLKAVGKPMFAPKEKLLLAASDDRMDEQNYDSINDEEMLYPQNGNDYQVRFMNDFDTILSFLYFIMCFTSLFISGINFGIIFGIFKLQEEKVRFALSNNLLVCTVLIFGFLFAFILSTASINLNMQRFRDAPALHTGIVWAGFSVVTVSIFWTLAIACVQS